MGFWSILTAFPVDLAITSSYLNDCLYASQPVLFAMKNTLSLLLLVVITSPALSAESKTQYTLASQRKPGQTDRVVAMLEVGGETKFTDEGKPQREKMSVVCNLDYFEKNLEVPSEAGGIARSIRDYQKSSATVKVGDGQFEPALKPEHRLIAVETAKQSALLFSPFGNLTRDELDAIDIQGNSLLLDRLLPEKPVAVGDTWNHSEQLLAALLGLDEVAKTTVQSTLKEVKEEGKGNDARTLARFEITGRVEGAIYGVSTVIEVKGKYRFNMQTKRIDWLGLLVKEERESSFVTDGVDVISRLQMTVTPVKEPASLADAALAKLALKPSPELTCLTYEAADDGWQCQYDRRWYVYHQRPKNTTAVLRLLDRGMLAGQCNLSSLVKREPDKLVSLEEFQQDVRRALDKSFGEFIDAGQSSNDADCRVYRVVVHGTSSDIAMRWIYYLVANPQGRQVAFTFAVEQNILDRFADADKTMAKSLRFGEEKNKGEVKQEIAEPAKKGKDEIKQEIAEPAKKG